MSPSDKVTSPPAAAGLAGRVPAGEYVSTARRLAEISADLQRLSVIAERIRGVPWEAIGHAHGGLSRAAVHARYAPAVKAWEEEHPGTAEEQFAVVDVLLQGAYAEIDLLLERQRELSRLSHATAHVAVQSETDLNAKPVVSGYNYGVVYMPDIDSRVAALLARHGRERVPVEDPLDRTNIARLLEEFGGHSVARAADKPAEGARGHWVSSRRTLLPPTERRSGSEDLEARVAALEEAVERLLGEKERDQIS